MAKRARPSRWLSQAALQALVRFGPEESGLRAAAREAKGTFHTTVRQADATSRAIRYEVDRARPTVRGNYDQAGLSEARAASVAAPDLANPGVPASLRAAVAAEQSGYTQRLAESRAADLTGLSQRRVQAVEGAGFAKSNAQRVLASDLSKLFARAQDVRRERGAFTVATAQQLQTAAERAAAVERNQEAGRAVTRRGQTLSHQDRVAGRRLTHKDRVAAQKIAAQKKAGGGGQTRGGATRAALGTASDEISRLIHEANGIKGDGAARHDAMQTLLKGAKERRIPVHDKLGKPLYDKHGLPVEKVVPGLDKAKSALLLSVALDVAYDGHVSRENHSKLLARGLSVRDLGLPSYGDYVRRQRARTRRARSFHTGGPNGTGTL
jgi:hypothetical protein